MTPRVLPAVAAYLKVAQRHQVDPVHMALAWCRTRPFMCSAIFGATQFDQLKWALGSVDITLSQECLADIADVHEAHPMPYWGGDSSGFKNDLLRLAERSDV